MAFLKADFWKLSNIITLLSALARTWAKLTWQYNCTLLLSLMDFYSQRQNNASRQKTLRVVLSLFLLGCHYHSYCSRRLEQKTWTAVNPLVSPTYFAIYACWVTLAKLGGWQTKNHLFFFTDSKVRLGWTNKMIWCGVLEWGQNAGVVLPSLTFLCTFFLEKLSFCFLISYAFAIYRIFYSTRSLSSLLYSKTDFSQPQRLHQWQDDFWFMFLHQVIWSYLLPAFSEVVL